MSKSVAELRASKMVGRPERSYTLCVAPKLIARLEALDEEFIEAHESEGRKPARNGVASRAKEVAEQQEAIREEMKDHTGTVTLRARDLGEWRRWCQEHPAREDDTRDKRIAYERCDVDALIADLGAYAVEWNGEPLDDGDWSFLAGSAAGGDLDTIAQTVIAMHETAVDIPKSRLAWLSAQRSADDSK